MNQPDGNIGSNDSEDPDTDSGAVTGILCGVGLLCFTYGVGCVTPLLVNAIKTLICS